MENQFSPPFTTSGPGGSCVLARLFSAPPACVLAAARPPQRLPRLQEIPARPAGVKGEQDGWVSSDFYGVLGTGQDQTAAST